MDRHLVIACLVLQVYAYGVMCSNEDFWRSAITGSIHEISEINDLLSGTSGQILLPSQAPDPLGQLQVTVSRGSYHRLALILPKTLETQSCPYTQITVDYGQSQPHHACMPNATNAESELSVQSFNISNTVDPKIIITFGSHSQIQAGDTLSVYGIYYQLYMVHTDDEHLVLPSVLATCDSFPTNTTHVPKTISYHFDVVLFESITLELLAIDVGGASCDEVYVQIGDQKLCRDRSNFTVEIPESNLLKREDYIIKYTSTVTYQGVSMLVKVKGQNRRGLYGVCQSKNLIIPSSVKKGSVLSPGWPYGYSGLTNQCHLSVGGDLISYKYTPTAAVPSRDCTYGRLAVGADPNNTFCPSTGNITREYVRASNSLTSFAFTKSQANVSSRAFRVDFETFSFENICTQHATNITTLPYMLKSPGFPSNNYPNNKDCSVRFSVPGVTTIMVEFLYMDLDASTGCNNDHMMIDSRSLGAKMYCGEELNANLTVNGDFHVTFHSDRYHSKSGFAIRITSPQTTTTTSTTTTTTKSTTTTTTTTTTTKPSKGGKAKTTISPAANTGKQEAGKSSTSRSIGLGISIPLVLIIVVVIVIFVLKSRRRHHILLRNSELDVGFENPIFGQRQSMIPDSS